MSQVERRAMTRQRLLAAAAEVFEQQGFHATTVDDVAHAAGYTKGAVYGHFDGKEALFLALLDRHLDDQVAQVDRLLGDGSRSDPRADLRHASARQMTSGGGFGLLTMEFWLYAARNAEARAALASRYERIRERIAAGIADRLAATDERAPLEVAIEMLALDAGLFLQHLLDPDAVTPELRAGALAAAMDPRA